MTTDESGRSSSGGQQSDSGGGNRSTSPDFRVTVVARQFSFGFSYPKFDMNGRQELVLPADAAVELVVTSEDVSHSFGVQDIGIKVDAVPDERATETITPEETGEYTARCYELCGEGHSDMTAPVRIVSNAEFERWRS